MNVHYCTHEACKRGFWSHESLGAVEKLPIHDLPGRKGEPCPNGIKSGKRPETLVVKAPGAS